VYIKKYCMLTNKNAVVFGAGGSLGGAVSRAFAAAGANVFLTGHHIESLQPVLADIRATGGKATTMQVDALKEAEVNGCIDTIVAQAGSVDISFNAVGLKDTQNIPLIDMKLADFMRPIEIAMETQFITASAVSRAMARQGSGVILSITATPGGVAYALVGGFGPACCAIEGFSRNLAAELGPQGVRVLNLRSAGSPDSRPFMEAIAANPELTNDFITKIENDTMLKKLPMMADIANVAVFLASDMAAKITGVTIEVTSGSNGVNYRTNTIPFVYREFEPA
jgi:3-oxoacyl-[acyl-carrier protein] reductase